MASKTTGKAQGRSRPQAQGKENKQKQSKASSESGRGGSGSGGAKGAANGTASRKGGEQRSEQQRKTRPEARERSRPQQDEGARDQAQQGQDEGQEQSQQGGGGNITKVAQTAKQHPVTTAASIAGLTLLAAQGLRMAISSMSGNGAGAASGGASSDEDEERGEDDEDSPEASYDEDDESQEGEEDADSAQASAEDQGEESDQDEDDQEGEGGGRFGGISSALRSSGNAIRRGAQSGYDRGREAAGQNWQSHPLVMCGLAIAVGAAAGFLLPSTRQEDQWMGQSSDKVTGRLRKTSKQFFRHGRQMAGRVVSEAVNTTAKEAEREGLTPDRLGKKVKRVVSSVREAVSNAVQDD